MCLCRNISHNNISRLALRHCPFSNAFALCKTLYKYRPYNTKALYNTPIIRLTGTIKTPIIRLSIIRLEPCVIFYLHTIFALLTTDYRTVDALLIHFQYFSLPVPVFLALYAIIHLSFFLNTLCFHLKSPNPHHLRPPIFFKV